MSFRKYLEQINENTDTEEVILNFTNTVGLTISSKSHKDLSTTIYISKNDIKKLMNNEKVKSIASFSY